MAKKTKWIRISAMIMILAIVLANIFSLCLSANEPKNYGSSPYINQIEGDLNTGRNNYLNSSVMYKLPDSVQDTDVISVIITKESETLLDAYKAADMNISMAEYATTPEGLAVIESARSESEALMAKLDEAGISYEVGEIYDTLLCGFEIEICAGEYDSVCDLLSEEASVIVGDTYEKCDTELVENTVNVYETGIFNSEGFGYDGTGVVVAVLDTGLDYTHTAFSLENFTADRSKLGMTLSDIASVIGDTAASGLYPGLTAEDVYLNEKVPYSFDYADKDPDVFPIQSDHGTHVSGIIAGKDDVITGVAPNAQIAAMKIFSDTMLTARTSWILGALEDCVVIGVDVINLSIGTSCGFAHETEKEMIAGVYDNIREAGISLIVAASNSYNSTYGSEKNGNLGLTSNPDSATIGSPSTYKGALAIASISGTKTPYLLYNDEIIYFTESADRFSEEKNFVDELLGEGQNEIEIDFVKIPGVGRAGDYTGMDVTGKIVLVERGSTTFEDKVNTAQKQGAAGVIVYNNVSGEIKMNVGSTTIPSCSIRQDAGEALAKAGKGTLVIKRNQTSGPFMSDFSSWGPNPNLELKPELTAHGGSILSSVPGQDYDRISGTSMATPNVSGLAALLRQYVKENFPEIANNPIRVTAFVNQLLMSTADIVYNTNGLPYSVRKQGAGLANLVNSAATDAYIITYDRTSGEEMDKSKIELGDDPSKTGIYDLTFSVKNFGDKSLTYDISAYVMTEGVSETKTNDGETTVTEQGYILDGAKVELVSVSGGTKKGMSVTVAANSQIDITVRITLSEKDKNYLDTSFANGMYVEGFIVLDSPDESTVDLSAPYLAFYGDWTKAPLFDIDYYETNKDEIDDSIDLLDKTLPDAYATRPVGGTELDYVSFLGSYYFQQNPNSTLIAADRKYISLSNQSDTVNSLRFVWAGLLRNAAKIDIVITDDATGEIVYQKTETDVRKSYGDGGSIYPANVEIEFSAIENNLKNNTRYTVTLKGYVDYGDGGAETNLNNTFTFPLVTDFQAPTLTDCEFYTEYDRVEKKNRLFAKMAVYDNHYAMSLQIGQVGVDSKGEPTLNMFDKYLTPVYSEENSTTYVTYELTDYIDEIKQSYNKNTFTVVCYDYALNQAAYEIGLPDDFTDVYFDGMTYDEETNSYGITLSPNEVFNLNPLVYPETEWSELIEYSVLRGSEYVKIVGNQIVALKPSNGQQITVVAKQVGAGSNPMGYFTVNILGEGDKGYKKYEKPVAQTFELSGYEVEKAFYFLSTDQREIGMDGDIINFSGTNYYLSMYPSEAVNLIYELQAYFPDITSVSFKSSNPKIATVDDSGRIVAVAEGETSIAVRVTMKDDSGEYKNTSYRENIRIEVKDPYVTTGPVLANYYGCGDAGNGIVVFPEELAVNEIGQYAFSNFDYIPKTENDEISEEEPDLTKIWYLGNNTIKKVVIPKSVKKIGMYAFAGLTALEEVVFEEGSEITTIDVGAFYNCTSLKKITGIENVKFFNQYAFLNTSLVGELRLDEAVAIGDGAFAQVSELCVKYNKEKDIWEKAALPTPAISSIVLSDKAQSIGREAFYGSEQLVSATIGAEKVKLGMYAFAYCEKLESIDINASVIPMGAFEGCEKLTSVTIGPDVESIGENAFAGTGLASFGVADGNTAYLAESGKPYLTSTDGQTLLLVAPKLEGDTLDLSGTAITAIANGALSGNTEIKKIIAPGVTSIGDYAFYNCRNLTEATFGSLTVIGNYSFFGTGLTSHPAFDSVSYIGSYAFSHSNLEAVTIPDKLSASEGITVGEGAFSECKSLKNVYVGDYASLGTGAFMLGRQTNYQIPLPSYTEGEDLTEVTYYYYKYTSPMESLVIGDNVTIGNSAFMGASEIESITLGGGAVIDDMAFYNCASLKEIDLAGVISIGKDAFSGDVLYEYTDPSATIIATTQDGTKYRFRYYAPLITSVTLTSLESLGDGAFAYCTELISVDLGDAIVDIPERAFLYCIALSEVNFENIESIGNYAFESAAFASLSLPKVTLIGNYAFVYCYDLEALTLGSVQVSIGEGAFAYCDSLAEVANLSSAESLGSYSFAYTALTSADLSGAVHIGEAAFAKNEMTDFSVTLGESLESLGDNPFAFCRLSAFSKTVKQEILNGKNEKDAVIYTFDISDKISVIDGSLYRLLDNGMLELVSYAGSASSATVAENTSRISAFAFAGYDVEIVTLPLSLNSIGHKAFFGCEKLSVVVFNSIEAPILEEEYDESYFYTYDILVDELGNPITTVDPSTGAEANIYIVNIPAADKYGKENGFVGLGIVPYFMWNVTTNPTNAFYGANFVDHIGHIEKPLVMVRPSNASGYGTFVYSQYFGTVIDGTAAPDDTTLAAIAAIELIPERVSLKDKAIVEAARAAYDKIVTPAQQVLVHNYSVLTAAEKRIKNLSPQEPSDPVVPDKPTSPDENEPSEPEAPDAPTSSDSKLELDREELYLIALAALILGILIATVISLISRRKSKSTEKQAEPAPEKPKKERKVKKAKKSAKEKKAKKAKKPEQAVTFRSCSSLKDRKKPSKGTALSPCVNLDDPSVIEAESARLSEKGPCTGIEDTEAIEAAHAKKEAADPVAVKLLDKEA